MLAPLALGLHALPRELLVLDLVVTGLLAAAFYQCWTARLFAPWASPRERSGPPWLPPRGSAREGYRSEGQPQTPWRRRWHGSASARDARSSRQERGNTPETAAGLGPRNNPQETAAKAKRRHSPGSAPARVQTPACAARARDAGDISLTALRRANPPLGAGGLSGEGGPSPH